MMITCSNTFSTLRNSIKSSTTKTNEYILNIIYQTLIADSYEGCQDLYHAVQEMKWLLETEDNRNNNNNIY